MRISDWSSDVCSSDLDVLEVEDLTTVLGVLRQVDRYGGELREPLLETMQIIEERRGFELREKVNLMTGRMTVVMVLFFFPALLIFIAGPVFMAIITAMDHVNGQRHQTEKSIHTEHVTHNGVFRPLGRTHRLSQ